MVFSSILFIFAFFPIVFIAFSLSSQRYRILILLIASFAFYFWGEQEYIFVILVSILINFLFGRWIESSENSRIIFSLGIVLNLALLIYFKYTIFLTTVISKSSELNLDIHLPLGISFFTFQGISYLFDVYRKDIFADKSLIRFSFYISFFPQLIAGPIVRYSEVFQSLEKLKANHKELVSGLTLFVIGLGKKVLIANNLGIYADEVFSTDFSIIGSASAWLAILSYSFQIYFDFSGYSDMAIGLGRIFGITFPINFNYPYSSLSIQEFWRRWHITLSSWFRDYLYIPMGGNRVGYSRQIVNLFLVFLLCGFWHGASWNFIIWGIFHGFFLMAERTKYKEVLNFLPSFIKFMITFFIINIGWVFFRTNNLTESIEFLKILFGGNGFVFLQLFSFYDMKWVIGICFSVLFAFEWRFHSYLSNFPITKSIFGIFVFLISIFFLVANNYNPFIYFRF
ncbi:MBOAT family protein [Leptospira sp. WS39.C2]